MLDRRYVICMYTTFISSSSFLGEGMRFTQEIIIYGPTSVSGLHPRQLNVMSYSGGYISHGPSRREGLVMI